LILPPIYPILDTGTLAQRGISPVTAAEAFLEAGGGILQYRHKGFFAAETFEEAHRIANLCSDARAHFVLNDRADYAALLNAGLHVGQDDLAPEDARKALGPQAILGFSTHNADQMRAAQTTPADYLAFGPIFATVTKQNPDRTTGIEGLKEIRKITAKPLVAIGGITLSSAEACFEAGADSVAVISGLLPEAPTKTALRARMTEWLQLSVILHKWQRPHP